LRPISGDLIKAVLGDGPIDDRARVVEVPDAGRLRLERTTAEEIPHKKRERENGFFKEIHNPESFCKNSERQAIKSGNSVANCFSTSFHPVVRGS
jgi:hypothetical protein